MSSKKWGIFLCAMVLVVYLPAMEGGKLWDDQSLVLGNPLIRAGGGILRVWVDRGQKAYYPVTNSLGWVEYHIWGERLAGWHLVNVLLHMANALLFRRVLDRLGFGWAWWAAMVFAVHPVCVESVAWISETKTVLSLMFCLLATLAYLGERYAAAGLLFLAGLLSKTTVVGWPIMMGLVMWWKNGWRLGREDFWRLGGLLLLAAGMGGATVWFEWHNVIGNDVPRSANIIERVLAAVWGVWFYAWKAVMPTGLVMIYPRWEARTGDWLWWMPAAGMALAGVMVWRNWLTWGRGVVVVVGCAVAGVMPLLGFVDISYFRYSLVADHFQYVSLLAWVAGGAWVVQRMLKNSKVRAGVGAAVVVVFAVLSWKQAGVYADARTLWADVVTKNPEAWAGWVNLGNVVMKEGNVEGAMVAYQKAIAIHPNEPVAHVDLGEALLAQGRYEEAGRELFRGGELAKIEPRRCYVVAHQLRDEGRTAEAIQWYREAIRREPALADAHAELGGLLVRDPASIAEGVGEFRAALKIKPDWVDVLNGLAWVLATDRRAEIRDGKEAVRLATRACELTGNKNASVMDTLAAGYAECGEFGKAVEMVEKAMPFAESDEMRRRMERSKDLYKSTKKMQAGP